MSNLIDAAAPPRPPTAADTDDEQDDDAPLELQQSACVHYSRDNQVLAECCNQLFWCRLCHDEAMPEHTMDRFATKLMVCVHCGLVQPVARSCEDPICCAGSNSVTSSIASVLSAIASAVKVTTNSEITSTSATSAATSTSTTSANQCTNERVRVKSLDKCVSASRRHANTGPFCTVHYFCETCRLWDNDRNKSIFHCDSCGICRVGTRADFYHCDKCNLCLPNVLMGEHTCLQSTADNNCPVCYEHMFTSRSTVSILECGHSIHSDCLRELIEVTPHGKFVLCPFCRKTAIRNQALTGALAHAIATSEMPEEVRDMSSEVQCNDCEKKSECPLNYIGHRCAHCGSFNTVVVRSFRNNE